MTQGRKLEKRNVLITGGSRGIGRAIAHRFAEEGANLFLCARRGGPLEEVVTELQPFGGKIATHVADVSDQRSVQEMVQHALNEFKQIDILVNNAGIYIPNRFVDYSLEEFDQVIKVNLYGVFLVTQAVLPGMIERKKGKVINIASTAGKIGTVNQSAYNASKHGVIGLTRCVGLEMAAFNINVNAICPSLVDETDMLKPFVEKQTKILRVSGEDLLKQVVSQVPMHRFVHPEEIANLALYLASDESDGMTAQSIAIDCGRTMV